jgi:hypothetical protein
MAAIFDAANFSLAPEQFPLVELIGYDSEWDQLAERFGTTWKNIPGGKLQHVRYVRDKTKDIQLTLMLRDGEPFEIAIYTETFEYFKTHFVGGFVDAVYVQLKPKDSLASMAGQVIAALKAQELW